ncbi:MAG: neprosin family prolyl endopeptidase [Candidatus Schekmanbacteria bacterium]|nr:neprosin family prolyl endopeptidase [Candidatus Schekmanbacteria bacterium]
MRRIKEIRTALYIFGLLPFCFGTPSYAADPFSIVVLPDTQYYSKSYPDTYYEQTQWIVDNRSKYNIAFAAHVGDITNNNTVSQWEVADSAHATLDDSGIPYSMVPGNHDYPDYGRVRDTSLYNTYFGPSRFSGESWYGGHMGQTNDNNYAFFESNNLKFLVISISFAPDKDVLEWAHDVVGSYPQRRVIVVTHCYQDSGGEHRTDCACDYDITGSCGDVLWDEFVKLHSNIFMVLSGHISDSEYKQRLGRSRNPVHEILTDYQSEVNGGNGWLRLITFHPEDNLVDVESISATGASSFTHSSYNSSSSHSDHKYSFTYDMTSPITYVRSSPYSGFSDMTVNTVSDGQQLRPRVASNDSGNVVVVWEDDSNENGVYQIHARGLDLHGFEAFSDITINSVSSGQQRNPAVAIDKSGNFVVAWEDDKNDNGYYEIMARGFFADGTEKFGQMTVNRVSSGQQRKPTIAMNDSGSFVVAWEDDQNENGYYEIMARGFYASGSQRFGQMTVNSVDDGQQLKPAMAIDDSGNFVVAWEDDQDENGYYQVMARGFSASGSQRFGQMTVNSVDAGQQLKPAIAMDDSGNFVVAWEDDQNKNSVYQVMARGFLSSGSQAFADKTINVCSDGQQYEPSVSISGNHRNFLVAWEDDKDGNGYYQILLKGITY